MKNTHYAPNVREAIKILADNDIILREVGPQWPALWQTVFKDFSGNLEYRTWPTWIGACGHFARYCDSDRLYTIVSGQA